MKLLELYNDIEIQFYKDYSNGKLYNVFNSLGINGDELKHSNFISDLLNPKGKHGLKNQFLIHFAKVIGVLDVDEDFKWLYKDIEVHVTTEYFVGNRTENAKEINYGRIDILIENKEKSKAIIIENKLFAKDQPQQLYRYSQFANEKYGTGNYKIVYLNLNGEEPDDITFKLNQEEDETPLKEFCIYINYSNHIIDILKLINQENKTLPVVFALEKYIDLLYSITQNNEDFYSHLNNSGISKEFLVKDRDRLRKDFLIKVSEKVCLSFKYELINIQFVSSINKNISVCEIADGSHPKNLGFKIIKADETILNVEVQDWSRLIYGVFNPNNEINSTQKLIDLGYEYKPWWLSKEFRLSNSFGLRFNFYDDYLNYNLSTNMDNMVNEFAELLIIDLKRF